MVQSFPLTRNSASQRSESGENYLGMSKSTRSISAQENESPVSVDNVIKRRKHETCATLGDSEQANGSLDDQDMKASRRKDKGSHGTSNESTSPKTLKRT